MSMPSQAVTIPCQCHAHAWSQCHLSLPSLVPCHCNANAMPMPVPCQCHVNAMSSMPCHRHVSYCALMAHTILVVPYLKPNRGWASPCPTCISNTINHTEPCECHVSAISVLPCQCHGTAKPMPCQCHVKAMTSQCRCCSRNKTCMSEKQHQGSMYI